MTNWPDEPPEHKAARAVLEPYIPELFKIFAAVRSDCREPKEIEIPRHFPSLLVGGTLFGLPIVDADVDRPRLLT